MHRTTQKWIIFAGVLVAGLILSALVDFVLRRPGLTMWLIFIAVLASGRLAPYNYTINALERVQGLRIDWLRDHVVPLAILSGMVWSMLCGLQTGGLDEFLVCLIALYACDRVLGWTVNQEWDRRQWRQIRQHAGL